MRFPRPRRGSDEYFKPAQQVWIDLPLQVAATQVRAGGKANDAHLAHIPLDALPTDLMPLAPQGHRDPPRAIKRVGRVQFINPVLGNLSAKWRDVIEPSSLCWPP